MPRGRWAAPAPLNREEPDFAMTAIPSAEERFRSLLQPFRFDPSPGPDEYAVPLAALKAALPQLPPDKQPHAERMEALTERHDQLCRALADFHAGAFRALTQANLKATHSFQVLFAHARLMDALHRFALEVALEDLPALIAVRAQEAEKELAFKQKQLPRKQEKLAQFLERRDAILAAVAGDPAERDYHAQLETSLARDVQEAESALETLRRSLPAWRAFRLERGQILGRLVLFARGGYGRGELSFGSDLDTGYCLDTRGLEPGEAEVYRELILRTEGFLNGAGQETAHQYFEIDEDLSRFTEPETLHTIPSILESRALAGNTTLLDELKGNFRALLPFNRYLRQKLTDYESAVVPGLTRMDLKEDFGGLRSIQIPLWIMGALHGSAGFMTADLLLEARNMGYLSLYEVARLFQALEMLYELRNFCGAAERFYYDQEARDSNFVVTDFSPNRIDDAVARLYLFRKSRFPSVDRLDAQRLRVVDDVQKLSRALLERVLDRTQTEDLGPFRVAVHLGRKRITAIGGVARAQPGALTALFPDSHAVLVLAGYIAATGYDLTGELKDALAEVVVPLRPAEGPAAVAEQAAQWRHLLCGPHAHTALGALLEVRDPLAPGVETLLGRFIPEFNRLQFILRGVQTLDQPLHLHLLRAVASGQEALDGLRHTHPELAALLRPEHVLALKWSLLLHAGCALEGAADNPARSAELAAELLVRVGFQDAELERRVRLLIEHCKTVSQLGKASSFLDQGLVQYFEIADRNIVNVVLLYLANLAVLKAGGERFDSDAHILERLFDEASRIFAELRGIPSRDRSLELINVYFTQKKDEQMAETRIHLLLQKSFAQGLREALFEPLRRAAPAEWERLQPGAAGLAALQREIVLGNRNPEEQEALVQKFVRTVRQVAGEASLRALTAERNALFTWFFAAFPNRYLLGLPARGLATQMSKFTNFLGAPVLVDTLGFEPGGPQGLLIATRRLERSHTRVAYALSRLRVNIILGKVNRVAYAEGDHGFCYYFRTSPLPMGEMLSARDVEFLIEHETPPELGQPGAASPYHRSGVRVEFLGIGPEGYQVEEESGEFQRVARDLARIRVVMRDQPFLFFKVTRVFERFQAELRQALITTTGNQVVDTFFLSQEDFNRLQGSNFEEFLVNRLSADLMASVE